MQLKEGRKPEALARIENKDLYDFIAKCIGPADSRPTAKALLEDE